MTTAEDDGGGDDTIFFLLSAPTHHRFCSTLYTQIKLKKQKDNNWPWAISLVIDETDSPIQEPSPFSKDWYSHKYNGPGVRYEVATSIQTGMVCWINGPFRPGVWPDDAIYKSGLYNHLPEGKLVHADCGYFNTTEEMFYITPNTVAPKRLLKANHKARARHEIVNSVYKKFNCLDHVFRHGVHKHGKVFCAVTSMVYLIMLVETQPYVVPYTE